MSELTDKCCGACKHFTESVWEWAANTERFGVCGFPLPISVKQRDIKAAYGTDCPCFERKDVSDGEK